MASVVNYRLAGKKSIGRSKGKSAVGFAAYISREKLKDEEFDKVYDYTSGHSKALFSKLFLPYGSPRWSSDREQFWNAVQKNENRKNSQFARMWEVSLPYQLTTEQMISTLENFVKNNFTRYGIVVDVALHEPNSSEDLNSERNYHAHLLQCLRPFGSNGFTGNKLREWKVIELLKERRESWAIECFNMLSVAGLNIEAVRWRYGYLTLEEQRKKALERGDYEYARACNHKPTTHEGVAVRNIKRKNVASYIEEYKNKQELKRQETLIKQQSKPAQVYQKYNSYNVFLNKNVNSNVNVITEDMYKKYKFIISNSKKVGDLLSEQDIKSIKIYQETLDKLNQEEIENSKSNYDSNY